MKSVIRCKDCTGWSWGESCVCCMSGSESQASSLMTSGVLSDNTHTHTCKTMRARTHSSHSDTLISLYYPIYLGVFLITHRSEFVNIRCVNSWDAQTARRRNGDGGERNEFLLSFFPPPSVSEHDIVHCKQHLLCKRLSCQVSRVWSVVQALQEVQVLQGWERLSFFLGASSVNYGFYCARSCMQFENYQLKKHDVSLNKTQPNAGGHKLRCVLQRLGVKLGVI